MLKQSIIAKDYYARQIQLPELGATGQGKLTDAKVLVVGVGGLGAAAAVCLAAAGVGTIILADPDVLHISNLHRQMIYNANDIGKFKVELAKQRLQALNPLVTIDALALKITAENVAALFLRCDIVLDCTDNFAAKYLLNDAALHHKKPLVQASIYRFDGQLLTIDSANGAGCLRCLFPEPPPIGMVGDCAQTGVLGTVPALFGTLQANEAIKYILGLGASRELVLFDLRSLESKHLQRQKNPTCKVCAGITMTPIEKHEADVDFIAAEDIENLRSHFYLIDVRETPELLATPIPNALHMPTSYFDTNLLAVPRDTPLLLICAKGMRSRNAAQYLRGQGWSNAYSLVGGIANLLNVVSSK